jgi:hypothetical protein
MGLATDRNALRFLETECSSAGLCLVGPVSLFGNLEPTQWVGLLLAECLGRAVLVSHEIK